VAETKQTTPARRPVPQIGKQAGSFHTRRPPATIKCTPVDLDPAGHQHAGQIGRDGHGLARQATRSTRRRCGWRRAPKTVYPTQGSACSCGRLFRHLHFAIRARIDHPEIPPLTVLHRGRERYG
jgi:hypothetical protein